MRTFQPLQWQSSGNSSCCLWFQIYFKGCVFLQSSESVGRGFHCNCRLAPSRSHWGLLRLTRTHSPSTSTHWHILSPPSSRSLSWHLQFILPPKMHLEHPDYVLREIFARFCLCLCRGHIWILISVKQETWRNYPGKDNSSCKMPFSTRMLKITILVLFFLQ